MIDKTQYKQIPSFSRYWINKKGDIYDTENIRFLRPMKTRDGYLVVNLTDDGGYHHTVRHHRVMCFVFQGMELYTKEFVVNHINGIKDDNRIENLEYITNHENIEHAGWIGLSPKCLPCKVYNHRTGEETIFPSIKKACDYIGVSKDSGLWRLKNCQRKVVNGFELKLKDDNTPWATLPESLDISLLDNMVGKEVFIHDILLGKELFFNKLQEAADYLGVVPSVLTRCTNQDRQKIHVIHSKIVRVQSLVGYENWEPITDLHYAMALQGYAIPICVSETEEKKYFSCVECAFERGISVTLLNYRLSTNFKSIFSDGYRYGYYIDFVNSK